MRNKTVLSVSVGIPAYNEEKNIKKLMDSILSQTIDNYVLKEIIIVSDRSTDNTVKLIKKVKNKKIKLIINDHRLGLAMSQNKLIENFSGDILILFNADVLPTNKNFIANVVKPFYKDSNLGIIAPKLVPLKAEGFIEKIINYSVSFKKNAYEKWNNGNNLLLCCGGCRVFSKKFLSNFKFPKLVAEDAYSYLACKKRQLNFLYFPHAAVHYRSPDNFYDHQLQSARFLESPQELTKYFPDQLVIKNYALPKSILIKTAIQYLIKNPFLFISYLMIFVLIVLNPNKRYFLNRKWHPAISTKYLLDEK